MTEPAARCDVLVIGAGFAGAATAYHWCRQGAGRLILLEAEPQAGRHASGRNAGLVLQAVADPAIRALVTRSRAAYARRAAQLGFAPGGSLLLGEEAGLRALQDLDHVASQLMPGAEARARCPELSGLAFDAALHTPGDGTMDVARLLDHYLVGARRHGARLEVGCRVVSLRGPRPFEVEVVGGRSFRCDVLVVAAGAWAAFLGHHAGGAPLPLRPHRRHLFVLDGPPQVPAAPYVWSLTHELYFRSLGDELLFCICDETAVDRLDDGVDPAVAARADSVRSRLLPALAGRRRRRGWSCHRTKTPDGRFAVGWDPRQPGLFWVAGLGGHGMGASWAVGELAADLLRGHSRPDASAFAPGRFSRG